jgi:rod shape-determining protein MreD
MTLMRDALVLAITSLVLIVVQTTLVQFVTIVNAIPDLALLWIVYVAITRGKIAGTIVGFATGLLFDFMSGADGMLGLAALCKTLAGYVAGLFYNENKTEQTLSSWRGVVIVGCAALLHNALYFLIFLQGSDVGWSRALGLHGIPSSLYTTILALIPMAVFRRKYQ